MNNKIIVTITFPNNGRKYNYITKLDMRVNEQYRIMTDKGDTYDNAIVTVVKVTPAVESSYKNSVGLKTIIQAICMKSSTKKDSRIEKVIFNKEKRTTVVIWKDGIKTIIKCHKDDIWDEEKAIALCYMKRMLGNRSYFNEVLEKYCENR